MLANFLKEFADIWIIFNLFNYISFKALLAASTALLFSWIIGPRMIAFLQRKQWGEEIRQDGPQTHQAKAGTPTMGGFIILSAVGIPTLLWADLSNMYIQLIFLATLWMGVVGFIDDYLKTVKKKKKGLIAKYKLAGQVLIGAILSIVLMYSDQWNGFYANSTVPFFKNLELNWGILFIPMVIFVITATSNAVNLTDGLDGLAIGVSTIAMMAFAGIAYVTGNINYAEYLNIRFLPGAGELTIYAAALIGAGVGFLWYNTFPASVFMGDTGSLALGAALGSMAILLKKELILPLIGGVFVLETLSVIIQTMWFKYTRKKTGTGRRVFKMAPLHHHYELKGWPETQVVVRFWILAVLFALMSLATFKIR
jgi:phospho-N-acetylmuramoyl-pentapeptide-transferase